MWMQVLLLTTPILLLLPKMNMVGLLKLGQNNMIYANQLKLKLILIFGLLNWPPLKSSDSL